VSERAHSTAIRALLEAPLGNWSAFDYDDVPSDLPDIYVEITVTRRYGGDPRACGKRPLLGWRLTTRAVGGSVDEARWAREKVDGVLREKRIPALASTLVEFETENPIEPDDGRYSGLTTWTYAAPA
jgi:hypothetical protein